MQAVIMAGGKGTRLLSLTKDEIPKPMTPVCGKPILQWQIERLKENGITDIVLIIGHLGHKIQEFFGDGSEMGVQIRYIEETIPLGTAGAFYYLRPLLSGNSFFLVFGDVLFDIDLERMVRFHEAKKSKATLFVHPNTHPFDSDLVVTDEDERILKFDAKNSIRNYWYDNCVNAGLYCMSRKLCGLIPAGQKVDLEKDILAPSCGEGKQIYAYRSPEYVKDVGTVERIQGAAKELEGGYVASRNLQRKQKAIFLDRDGTVNIKNGLVSAPEEFELENCAVEAIRKINRSGYLSIIITNQPAVARGLCSIEDIEIIHKKMKTLLGREGVYLDDICYCPHHPDKGYPDENPAYKIPCHCRKPDIGMIEYCAEIYNIDLSQSWMIGDTTVDIQTGRNAGTKTALVLTGDAGSDKKYDVVPNIVCQDLGQAVEKILKEDSHEL